VAAAAAASAPAARSVIIDANSAAADAAAFASAKFRCASAAAAVALSAAMDAEAAMAAALLETSCARLHIDLVARATCCREGTGAFAIIAELGCCGPTKSGRSAVAVPKWLRINKNHQLIQSIMANQ
jgi:hypothetical protein